MNSEQMNKLTSNYHNENILGKLIKCSPDVYM